MKLMTKSLVACMMIAMAACGTTPQGAATSNEDSVKLETNIFAIKGNDTLRIDTYIDYSKEVPAEGRPVIIYIHGGGFTMGSRVNAAQEIFCRHMAEEGFLAASVDYRLAGCLESPTDGSIINPYNVSSVRETVTIACEDVAEATNYILGKAEWKANPKQVSVGGGSAGAVTALTIVYDVCNGSQEYTKKLPEGFAYAGVISQAGAVATLEDELVWKTKPCPMMFFHGSEDPLVPLGKADVSGTNCMGTLYIEKQLEEAGVPHWTWIEKGADHVMAMKPLTSYLEEQARFLKDFASGAAKTAVRTEWADEEPAGMSSVDQMLKFVPMYILGFGKYLDEIDWNNLDKPENIVF